MLIGLVGRARSGKGTVSGHLVEYHGFTRYGFADPLKEMLITAGMCSREDCYENKTDFSRWLMQKIGTEIFRKQVDPLYWVKKAEQKIVQLMNEERDVVVDDVRMPEEVQAIKNLGGIVVKIERVDEHGNPYRDPYTDPNHETERVVDDFIVNMIDAVITAQSGDLEALKAGITRIVEIEAGKRRIYTSFTCTGR